MVPPLPRSMVWSTSTPVVLTENPTLASTVMKDPLPVETSPVSRPAMPPVGAVVAGLVWAVAPGEKMMSAPEAFFRPGFSPPTLSLEEIEALAKAIRVTVWPPASVALSKATSAWMVTPGSPGIVCVGSVKIVMSMSLATTLTNGPRGSDISRTFGAMGALFPVPFQVMAYPPAIAATVTLSPEPYRASSAESTWVAVAPTSSTEEISAASIRPLPLTSMPSVKVPSGMLT